MSWLYITVMWFAALIVADDMSLMHIHPAKGMFIIFALTYNVAYTMYKWEHSKKECKKNGSVHNLP